MVSFAQRTEGAEGWCQMRSESEEGPDHGGPCDERNRLGFFFFFFPNDSGRRKSLSKTVICISQIAAQKK